MGISRFQYLKITPLLYDSSGTRMWIRAIEWVFPDIKTLEAWLRGFRGKRYYSKPKQTIREDVEETRIEARKERLGETMEGYRKWEFLDLYTIRPFYTIV